MAAIVSAWLTECASEDYEVVVIASRTDRAERAKLPSKLGEKSAHTAQNIIVVSTYQLRGLGMECLVHEIVRMVANRRTVGGAQDSTTPRECNSDPGTASSWQLK